MKHLPNLRLLSTKYVVFIVGVFLLLGHTNFSTPVEAKVSKVTKSHLRHVDAKQLKCLATNIYYEAGAESEKGKAAVARVVMNRVSAGFANTPCNVIYQSIMVTKLNNGTLEENDTKRVKVCQFSWVCEGKGSPNKNSVNYVQSEKVAYHVLANDGYKSVVSSGTLFFHNLSVKPSWNYAKVTKIGNHIFYEKSKRHSMIAKN